MDKKPFNKHLIFSGGSASFNQTLFRENAQKQISKRSNFVLNVIHFDHGSK